MKKIVILLTGAVITDGVDFMKRSKINTRLNDYKSALNKWLANENLSIVFIENSNCPKDKLMPNGIKSNQFEYYTYCGQYASKRRGKGYGEINSFEFVFNSSKTLRDADMVIKCNGRYYFKQINKLIHFLENDNSDIVGNFRNRLDFFDSRLFVFTPSFFQRFFIKTKEEINDYKGFYFEHALAKSVHAALSEGFKWNRLPLPLVIQGYSGTSGKKYNTIYSIIKIKIKFYLGKFFI